MESCSQVNWAYHESRETLEGEGEGGGGGGRVKDAKSLFVHSPILVMEC